MVLLMMEVYCIFIDAVASGLSCIDILKEPFFSSKVLRLIGILSSSRLVIVGSSLFSLTIILFYTSHES